MAGATLVGWDDRSSDDGDSAIIGDSNPNPTCNPNWITQRVITGDLLALGGAIMSGAYTIALATLCPGDSRVSMGLVFGYLGILNALFLGPFFFGLVFSNLIDVSELSFKVLLALVAKGLFDNVLADYLWARAVMLTTPTVATVGLSLTTPLAFTSDVILRKFRGTWLTGTGAGLVLSGFLLVNELYNIGDAEPDKCMISGDEPVDHADVIVDHKLTRNASAVLNQNDYVGTDTLTGAGRGGAV